MTLIDTHAHLYDAAFEADIEQVLANAQQNGIERIYLPAIDSEAHASMLQLEATHPHVCVATMGVHPCYIKDNYVSELHIAEKHLQNRPFAAIGEIGLDFYWDKTFAKQQYIAFDTQMEWALQLNLPIIIHTRNAMQETINRVKPFAQKGLRGIFHCFSGSAESAKQIIDMGFYLGIGGVLTYKNSGLPAALSNISLQHLVLETDAPYLPPVPFRGQRNQSSYLLNIAEKLAVVKETTLNNVAEITTANAKKIFAY